MTRRFFSKTWPALVYTACLLLASAVQSFSQGIEGVDKAEKILAAIDSLLKVEDYYKNRDKVPVLQKLLEQRYKELESIKDLHPSAEWRNTYQSYKEKLDKRRNAYKREKPPSKKASTNKRSTIV